PELARAPRPGAQQRGGEPCGRVVVHQPRRALAAEHTLVHGMVAVALDIADPPILQMNLDAAAAGAPIAGRAVDLVGGGTREVDRLSGARHANLPPVRPHRKGKAPAGQTRYRLSKRSRSVAKTPGALALPALASGHE